MKQVFSSPNNALVGLVQSRLEAAGIACEVRNDSLSQALPGMPFATELWVLRDEDYEEARQLIGSDETSPVDREWEDSPPKRPQEQANDASFWRLLLVSIASWPVLYLPVILQIGAGLGAIVVVGGVWFGLVLMNFAVLCRVVLLFCRSRPRNAGGFIGAGLAAIHSGLFVGISLSYVLRLR